MKNIKGNKYGRLLVLSENKIRKDHKIQWNCICDCGNRVIVMGKLLRSGNTKSCGCLQKEKARVSIKNFLLNNKSPNITHNMSKKRVYQTWKNILSRCNNNKSTHYKYYGGRGIKVCQEWYKFENFYRDMKNGYRDNLTIDRIDNSKGYSKENCRWINLKEQSNNRSNNHILVYKGEQRNITQWSKKLGIPRNTISRRIKRGWSIDRVLK